ncbi:phospholipase D-like domain-containing protein [Salinarchaeum laminariae]|uniref:phospholipase D-like domain-containing protein n=1 Tax=Salinarchaeum laminariae TaxID=869888 RepID=UPI0020C0CD30|nr:phospholipase D-like domain-containing protein [Salinarchaeum laminariae]
MTDDRMSAAISLAGILEYDLDRADQIEGVLLAAGGRDETVSPVALAHQTDLFRESAGNLFRQLLSADAVKRTTFDGQIIESEFRITTDKVRSLFQTTREAIRSIDAYRERQPPDTVAEPLITFPNDPAFAGHTPADTGMNHLVSALASEIKDASESVVIVAPFFEGTGLDRLGDVLENAVERGVDLTIITRYLTDPKSHNRAVIGDLVDSLRKQTRSGGQVRTIDYTVWADDVPADQRRQDGAKPVFTLHAKLMVFDGSAAYIGSANMTDYGFDRYLELGVLLRGPPVDSYQDLCEFLLKSDAANRVRL